MSQKRSKPAPLATGTGLGNGICSAALSRSDNSENLRRFQADFVAARYRLDAARARVVADLAWGRS
jgi:hypothetical protein